MCIELESMKPWILGLFLVLYYGIISLLLVACDYNVEAVTIAQSGYRYSEWFQEHGFFLGTGLIYPGLLQICCVAEDSFESLVLLLSLWNSRDCSHVPPCQVYTLLGNKQNFKQCEAGFLLANPHPLPIFLALVISGSHAVSFYWSWEQDSLHCVRAQKGGFPADVLYELRLRMERETGSSQKWHH